MCTYTHPSTTKFSVEISRSLQSTRTAAAEYQDCYWPDLPQLFPPRKTLLCTLVKTARPVLQNHVINLHAESCRRVTELILLPKLCPYLFSVPAADGGKGSSQLKAEPLAELRRHSSNQSAFRKGWQSCWEKTVQQFKGFSTELQAGLCLETVSWVKFQYADK